MKAKKICLREGMKNQPMKHRLMINVSRDPPEVPLMRCRRITMRERFLRRLFGEQLRMTVIVPGDTVESVAIEELPERGVAVGSG